MNFRKKKKSLAAAFAEAEALVRARDSAAAMALLQRIVAQDAQHWPSLHLLGLLAGRSGDDDACVAWLGRAIEAGTPDQAVRSLSLLAAAHRRAGRIDAAEAACRQALAIDPAATEARAAIGFLLRDRGQGDAALAVFEQGLVHGASAELLYGLGLCLLDAGQVDRAADALAGAVAQAPAFAPAHGALAAALLAQGALDRAAAAAEHAVGLAPRDPALARNLAIVRTAQGRLREAIALCRTALAGGEDAALLNTLGVALKEDGQLADAGQSLERALALQPGLDDALFNLAAVRKDQGSTDDAVALLRRLVERAPDLAAARFALCMAHLPPLYADAAEIDRRRDDYRRELDALTAYADAHGAAALAAGIGAAQPFYLAYQGRNDDALQSLYGNLVCRATAAAYLPVPLADPPQPGEPIRIGFVSGHFRDHSVWRLPTRGWVAGLDRTRFALIGYHTSPLRDRESDVAEAMFDRFVQGPMSVEQWRTAIVADRPHVLIYPEVGMDPMVARLAAMRLAPVQYASWGHPSTTGYPTIDYFLSSAAMEPADGADHYSERLVRLPGLSTPLSIAPMRCAPAVLGLPENATVFWCGQSLYKYLPQEDAIFAAIAERVPDSRFVFVEFPGSPPLTERFRNRLGRAFAARGLDTERHIVILPRMDAASFVAAMGAADIVLDSIGWSGCNSLVEAIGWGLPIVTLPGATMRSRHGAALLEWLGQSDVVSATREDYVDRAVALAGERRREPYRMPAPDMECVNALERHILDAVDSS